MPLVPIVVDSYFNVISKAEEILPKRPCAWTFLLQQNILSEKALAEKVDEKAKKEEEIGKFREQQPFVPKFLTNDLRYLAMMSMNLKRNGVKNHLQQCVKRIFKERWPEEFERREAGIGKKQIWD